MSPYLLDWRLLVTCSPQTAFMSVPALREGGCVMMPWAERRVGKRDTSESVKWK